MTEITQSARSADSCGAVAAQEKELYYVLVGIGLVAIMMRRLRGIRPQGVCAKTPHFIFTQCASATENTQILNRLWRRVERIKLICPTTG